MNPTSDVSHYLLDLLIWLKADNIFPHHSVGNSASAGEELTLWIYAEAGEPSVYKQKPY
jgi:hypothetical protein